MSHTRVFSNLAFTEYNRKANDTVYNELVEAGIPVLTLPAIMNTEVKTSHIGVLNGFVFTRAWQYWICKGDMPLVHAQNIYCQFKELSIRAAGHAGNPEPTPYSYSPIQEKREREIFEELSEKGIPITEIAAELNLIPAEDPTLPRFIRMYHIDTMEGLCAFTQFIKTNGIYACNGASGTYSESQQPTE